jgi:hypothetical protein
MSDIPETPGRCALLAWQFSLGGILLVMTLMAVCLALMRLAPLSEILLTVVCVPAAIRTAVSVRYHAWRGERLTMIGKVGAFVSSFLIVLWMVLLAGFTGIAIATLFAVPLAL